MLFLPRNPVFARRRWPSADQAVVDQDTAVLLNKDCMVYKLALCLGQKLAPDDADAARPAENTDKLTFGELAVGGLARFELSRQVFRREDGPQTIREVTHMLCVVALGRSGEAIVHQRLDHGENLRICHLRKRHGAYPDAPITQITSCRLFVS